MNTKTLTYIGSFSVDSGQAIVGDPCYLDTWENWNSEENNFEDHETKAGEYGYLGACGVTLKEGYGTLGMGSAVACLRTAMAAGVALFTTGFIHFLKASLTSSVNNSTFSSSELTLSLRLEPPLGRSSYR